MRDHVPTCRQRRVFEFLQGRHAIHELGQGVRQPGHVVLIWLASTIGEAVVPVIHGAELGLPEAEAQNIAARTVRKWQVRGQNPIAIGRDFVGEAGMTVRRTEDKELTDLVLVLVVHRVPAGLGNTAVVPEKERSVLMRKRQLELRFEARDIVIRKLVTGVEQLHSYSSPRLDSTIRF